MFVGAVSIGFQSPMQTAFSNVLDALNAVQPALIEIKPLNGRAKDKGECG
jgi:hypothetical protein